MASEKYYTVLTKTGQAKIANAIAYGRQLKLTTFALGDGGGSSYEPAESQTTLKREVYRAAIANIVVADATINMMEINMAVPATVGGFIVREMGIFDADGDLIALSKTPDDPKPSADSGAAKDVIYRLFIVVTNTSAVEIKVDGSVMVATKKEVEAVSTALMTHTADTTKHLTVAERTAWNAKTDQTVTAQLAELVNGIRQYKAFGEIDATYTEATALQTVVTAMADNSILRAVVTVAGADYPAPGMLEVTKQTGDNVTCTLNGTTGQWLLTITATNKNQIWNGGGGISEMG